MKKKLFITCLMAILSLCATAQDFYDITQYYLKNSLFDSDFNYTVEQTGNVSQELLPIAGWTAAHTADYTIAGIYQIGTKKTFNGASVPAENVDGTTEGGVLALSTGWAKSLILTQSITLPKGKYKLVSAYYNGDASVTAGTSLLAWIPTSGTSYKSKVTSFPVQQWVVDTLSFTYTTTKAGKIQIGFKAVDGVSGNSAKISIDYVKLLRDTPFGEDDITIHKSSLKTLLSTANTQYGTGEKRGAAALKAVIDEAQAIYDNPNVTFDEIDAVYAKLNEAVTIFKALQTADTALKNKLTTANKTANGATGEGIDALLAAISTAQAVYDNADATAEELTNAATALQDAIDTYGYKNPTGNIPTVVTDTRYARGATMAFGRLTVTTNGSSIKERGFCWSESPNPTVFDNKSTKTLTGSSNNGVSGTIYWLQDLKPATKYYMRAYAVTKGYQVAYGEQIKFYTIPMGSIHLSVRDGGDQATYNRIKQASEDAKYYWDNLTEMTDFYPSVGFVNGVPTADCSYGGWVQVGSNSSYQRTGTILHEWLHGVGVIPWANTEWSRTGRLRSSVNGDGYGSGLWLGDRVTEVVRFLQNSTTATLNGDYQHMWPFGINGASEDTGEPVLYIANGLTCQALGEDGLQHTENTFAEPYYALDQEDDIKYYLKNESESRGLYTSYLIPTATGVLKWREMSSAEAAANDSTAWYITFTPSNQYYQFRNAATGQYLTYNSGIKTLKRTSLTANDDWHLMKGRVDVDGQRGYWIIHPQTGWTPPCLQANANGATGSASFNIANSAETQRWLIMTLDEMQAAETKAVNSMKSKANDIIEKIKALQEVPHTEDIPDIDQTTTDAIQSLEARIAAATSVTEVLSIISEAQQTANGFLQNVSPSDPANPFDLTYMLVNPDMKSGNDGWSGTASINYECGEFYQTTFDYYQTVRDLPAGNYAFAANAFQRPGPYASASSVNTNATIYAGSKSAKLAHIKDDAQTTKVGTGNEVTIDGKYIPDNMQAASAYFKKGFYENRVFNSVANNGGSLKMGLKSTSMGTSYWVIFTNFRLYFYGKMSEETVLGINELDTKAPSQRTAVFTLDGRQLSPDTQLRPGLYIIDGRKTIIR